MATSITFTRAGFVAGTVYAVGDVATVSDTDATIAISSRIARYTTDPAPATSEAEVLIDLTSNMTTEQKTAFRSNIGAGTGEGGEGAGDVLSAAPVLAGSVVTTANAMGALVIDVTKSLNTKTITGNVTLSVSATPATSDTRSVLRIYNNSATASAITLPSSPAWYSEGLQADITSFTVPAYWRGELTWCYDGTRFLLNGDRMTPAQAASATGLGTTDVVAFGGLKANTIGKAANYTIGTDAAAEAYGYTVYVTSAATITLPAVAAGMSVAVVTIGAIAVSVDPNAADKIYLDGAALSDGDKITNTSTSGDVAVLTYYGADGWYASTNGWTDGN